MQETRQSLGCEWLRGESDDSRELKAIPSGEILKIEAGIEKDDMKNADVESKELKTRGRADDGGRNVEMYCQVWRGLSRHRACCSDQALLAKARAA